MTIKIKAPDIRQLIIENLLKGMRVKITGIGIFEVRQMKARKIMHPRKLVFQVVKPHKKIGFLPSISLKKLFK